MPWVSVGLELKTFMAKTTCYVRFYPPSMFSVTVMAIQFTTDTHKAGFSPLLPEQAISNAKHTIYYKVQRSICIFKRSCSKS